MRHDWWIYLLCSGLAALVVNEGAYLLGVPFTSGRVYDFLSIWVVAFMLQLVTATLLHHWWRR